MALKILFQEPLVPRTVSYGRFAAGAGNNTFPVGLASICSYIAPRGWDPRYLEPSIEGLDAEGYAAFLREGAYDLVGIGSTTNQIDYAFETFRAVKRVSPKAVTVLGGIHGTLLPRETLAACPEIDFLVAGEGEKPFHRLLEALEAGDRSRFPGIPGLGWREGGEILFNPPAPDDMLKAEDIPLPAYDRFPMEKYVAQITFAKTFPSYSVLATRGCPYRCAFCNACDVMGRKVRFKPVPRILEEIRILKERYGARGLMFMDSTFTINKRWLLDFCAEYRRSGLGLPWACNSRADTVDRETMRAMKDAGCWEIVFGIESANQKSLDLIRKGTTVAQNAEAVAGALALGLYVYTCYILCLPGETEEDAMNTVRFARAQGNQMALFYLPVPFPKTELWELCRADGGLRADARWADYNAWDYARPVYVNPRIGRERMREVYRRAYLDFYSNPVVLARNLKELLLLRQHPRKFWLGLKGFMGMLRGGDGELCGGSDA